MNPARTVERRINTLASARQYGDNPINSFASSPSDRSNHISPIEGFWGFAKRRLAKFNGIPWHAFYLHLKETKFRFNHRGSKLYPTFIRLLRNQPL